MSAAAAQAHQERHGFTSSKPAKVPPPAKVPKSRQNKTEVEYGLILEAMKRRGEILDYRPFGIKLEWGADPETGKPMVYSCDHTVFLENGIRLIECKNAYIFPKDLIRFKGCRAEWGKIFDMQMHQKTAEGWRRLL